MDAIANGVGAVLSHVIDGAEHPIYFESATLTPAEMNYSQLHEEALAMALTVTKLHKYTRILGKSIAIVEDYDPLK